MLSSLKIPSDKQIKINNINYISKETCIELMETVKSAICKNILDNIKTNDIIVKTNEIDIKNQIFKLNGIPITAIFDITNIKKTIWIKAKEVAEFLGNLWNRIPKNIDKKTKEVAEFLKYNNTGQAIIEFVKEKNKMNYENLLIYFPSNGKLLSKNIDKKTIFINLSGFMNLIHNSRKSEAIAIKDWIDDEVIPALYTYGSYSIQPQKLNLDIFS